MHVCVCPCAPVSAHECAGMGLLQLACAEGAGRQQSRLRQLRGVGVSGLSARLQSLPARSLSPSQARLCVPVPRPPLGSGKPGLCGTELPSRAVVQSARRAPSGAAGSSGRGEAALCELPCWLSRCLLGGAGHTSQPCGLTHRKCWAWGAGDRGGTTPGVPLSAVTPPTRLRHGPFATSPGDITRTRGPAATTMFRRKRSVSFGGFGW